MNIQLDNSAAGGVRIEGKECSLLERDALFDRLLPALRDAYLKGDIPLSSIVSLFPGEGAARVVPVELADHRSKWEHDGHLTEVSRHLEACARSWEPQVRLLGNCRADDIASIARHFITLSSDS